MIQKSTEFYSYLFQQEADVTAAYFKTKSSSEYRVYFYPAKEYFDQLKEGTILYRNSYYFGFTKLEPHEDKKEQLDFRVRNTIYKIIIEFFQRHGEHKILIFSYDDGDGRKAKRSLCFNNWFDMFIPADYFVKFDEEIIIASESRAADIEYMSIIFQKDNSSLKEIVAEFQSLKEQLIAGK